MSEALANAVHKQYPTDTWHSLGLTKRGDSYVFTCGAKDPDEKRVKEACWMSPFNHEDHDILIHQTEVLPSQAANFCKPNPDMLVPTDAVCADAKYAQVLGKIMQTAGLNCPGPGTSSCKTTYVVNAYFTWHNDMYGSTIFSPSGTIAWAYWADGATNTCSLC